MKKLFGTDGIRGKASEFPLDNDTMFALGETLTRRLQSEGSFSPLILLGMDTRESGPRIASALAAGIHAPGGRSELIGIVPTPGVAYLCRSSDATAGISISASHNPFEDNGVKVFGHDGMKLADELESEIEKEMLACRRDGQAVEAPPLAPSDARISAYGAFLRSGVTQSLRGLKIVIDTGEGAAFRLGPQLFRACGAEVVTIHDAPDGRNINEGCGALHPEELAAEVVRHGAALGVAFDGDADRAILVDDRGSVRNGDEVLYLWARRLKREQALANDTVVATVMSNFGFERKLQQEGIRLVRANVGDKYVLEEMVASGAVLGGEQSGHIIDFRVHTTGDGIHTALAVAELLVVEKRPFSLLETFAPMPQILLNEPVSSKPPLETLHGYVAAAAEAERDLAGRGRILVRYSGTENLVRVMVEGEDQQQIESVAERLVAAIRADLA